MRKAIVGMMVYSILILVATQTVRRFLLELGLPDGSLLEAMAEDIRTSEVSVLEAVSVFCRELVIGDAH